MNSALLFFLTLGSGILIGFCIGGLIYSIKRSKESKEEYEEYKDIMNSKDKYILHTIRLVKCYIEHFETVWYSYKRMLDSFKTIKDNFDYIESHPFVKESFLTDIQKIVEVRVDELVGTDDITAKMLGLNPNTNVWKNGIKSIPHGKDWEKFEKEINEIKSRIDKYEQSKILHS